MTVPTVDVAPPVGAGKDAPSRLTTQAPPTQSVPDAGKAGDVNDPPVNAPPKTAVTNSNSAGRTSFTYGSGFCLRLQGPT